MKSIIRFFVLGPGIIAASLCSAQTPTDLVQKALNSRDAIKAAEMQLSAAKHTASSLGALPGTRLEAGAGTRPDVTGGEDLTLFQPFDVFGKSRAGRAGGVAGVRSAEATLRQRKIDVQTEVITALAIWSNAKRNLETANEQLAITQQLERAAKIRVEARALPELQMTRASLEVQKAEQVVIDRAAAVQSALVKLRQSLGGTSIDLQNAVTLEIPIGMSAPERDRPELLLLSSQRAGFLADQRQAKLSLVPDFEIQARRSPWSEAERYGIRFQIALPLWDHGASKQKAKAAEGQATAASLEYADTVKRIQAEIDAAQIQLEAAKKSLTAYAKLAEGAKGLMEKTQRGFELGANTLIDVLDAKRTLSDTLEQLSGAQLSVDQASAELLRAQGQILGEVK